MSALAEKLFERALTALKVKDFESASGLCIEAIKYNPDFYEAWTLRGNILHAQEKPFDSLLHYDRALAIKSDLRDAWNNRALAFCDLGMWDAAVDSFNRSIAVAPSFEPYVGLANMYCTLMQLATAVENYKKALEYGDDPRVRFNLGVTMLGMGEWEEGFKQYECRWRDSPFPPRAHVNYPKWQGESLKGKTLLLYPEQGYGDEIMALRFADRDLLGADRIIVQVREPMLRLARTWTNDAMAMHGDIPDGIDYSSPLLDVPMCLKLTPKNLPRPTAYLCAPDPYRVDDWKDRLPKKGLNIGICWESGKHLDTARAAHMMKSLPTRLLGHFIMPGVNLISLQKPKVEIKNSADFVSSDIIDWTDEIESFSDTACLITALDMVISVDTAVAHLAGALGKKVWNFVRFSGYWPWLGAEYIDDPTYSIWYPNMVLYRQPKLNDWLTPVQKAKADLCVLLSSKSPETPRSATG